MAENGYIGRQPNDTSTVIARQQYVPTGITTTFTFVSGYDTGYVDVYMNGVRLAEGRDFTAGDGRTVQILNPATQNDVVEVVAYKAFNPTAVQNFTNIQNGAVGIQSGGTLIGVTTTINFIGTGNTIAVNGDVIDVSIEGGGGGGALGERLSEDSDKPAYKIYKQRKVLDIDEDTTIDSTGVGTEFDGVAYVAEADVRVAPSNTFVIGVGVTFKTNILGIFPPT